MTLKQRAKDAREWENWRTLEHKLYTQSVFGCVLVDKSASGGGLLDRCIGVHTYHGEYGVPQECGVYYSYGIMVLKLEGQKLLDAEGSTLVFQDIRVIYLAHMRLLPRHYITERCFALTLNV